MNKPIVLLNNKSIYLYKELLDKEEYAYISKYLKKVSVQSSYGDKLDEYFLDEYSIVSLILSGDEAISEFYDIMNKYSYNDIPISIKNDIEITKDTLRSVELKLGQAEVILRILKGDLSFLRTEEKFKSYIKYDESKEAYKFPRKDSLKVIKELSEKKVNIEFPSCLIKENIEISLKNNTNLRYYQQEAFETLKDRKGGLMLMPVSSGKNYVAIRIINHIKKKTLILCENKGVSFRWKKDLSYMLNINDIAIVEDENFKIADIMICSYEIIRRNEKVFDSLNMIEWGVILYDNAHKAVTERAVDVLYLKSEYKFALASTLNRSDNRELELTNLFRKSIYNITSQELLKQFYQKSLKCYKVDLKDNGYSVSDFISYVLNKYNDKRVLIVSYNVDPTENLGKYFNIDVIVGNQDEGDRERIIDDYNSNKISKLFITNVLENYRVNDTDIMVAISYIGKSEIEDDFRIGTLISTINKLEKETEVIKFYLIKDEKDKDIVNKKVTYLKKYDASAENFYL